MAGGGSNDAAEEARRDEEQRQARIRAGTESVNRLFDGSPGTAPGTGRATTYDPGQTYYTAGGAEYMPNPGSFGKPVDELNYWGRRKSGFDDQPLFTSPGGQRGTKGAPGLFSDDFFADRRQSYLDFARPQVDEQFAEASDQLTYSLARNGTSNSSTAGEQRADLMQDRNAALQDVVAQARDYETQARNAVEDARSNIIATLHATGDAAGATNSAMSRAAALSQTPAYSPVTQLFGDVTNGIATQAALERAEAASGKNYARYDTPVFGGSRGAVKVGG